MKPDDRLEIERIGGLAGMGLPGSHIRSHALLNGRDLSPAERASVAALFDAHANATGAAQAGADFVRYRLTLHGDGGDREIEVPERDLLESLQSRVHDELI